jgi:DnaJ-class molecular chaperone
MSKFPETCKRCNGSGEIGRRGQREAPGPVPEDARGWNSETCPDCRGTGMIEVEIEDDGDE